MGVCHGEPVEPILPADRLIDDLEIPDFRVLPTTNRRYTAEARTEFINEQEFELYPNPAHDYVIIEQRGELSVDNSIKIHSSDGSLVETKNFSQYGTSYIELKNYTPGIYFVSVANSEGRIITGKKFIVNK